MSYECDNDNHDIGCQCPGRTPTVAVSESDFGQLLAVATLYVDAFKDDEMMSLTERLRLQEIEDILDRHGRRY